MGRTTEELRFDSRHRQEIFLYFKTFRPTLRPIQPSVQGVSPPPTGIKQPQREGASAADVKNEWNYTSTPATCLYVVHRDNFTTLHLSMFFIHQLMHKWVVLKNNIKIYIKTAPTCFGAVTPSSESALFVLTIVTVIQGVTGGTDQTSGGCSLC